MNEEIFQLTTSRGGRHGTALCEVQLYHFQLTTSRGGRPQNAYNVRIAFNFSTHDLSWRSTVLIPLKRWQVLIFNSRPLVEVDGDADCNGIVWKIFNSRPLVEVDSKTSQ